MHSSIRFPAVLFGLLALAPAAIGATVDYAGWVYTSAYGDFPIRFHVDLDGKTPTLTYDSPAAKAFALPVVNLVRSGDLLTFERNVGDKANWIFKARIAGESFTGDLYLGDVHLGDFDATRTPLPIEPTRPDRYTDCAGTFRAADGSTLLVTTWQWGELRLLDLAAGAERTLFCMGEDQFFSGSAMYVPSPLESRITFVRNADDDVIGLDRADAKTSKHYVFTPPREEDVTFTSDGLTLHGTLTFPAGEPPYPAMVVLGGSNWTTRATVSRDAALFASLGLAVLTYDQRGFGETGGDEVCSFEQTAADARASAAMLAGRKDIDKTRIGVTGTSRGGWTAPLAASNGHGFAFVVIKVPPAVSPAQQEYTRRLNLFCSTPRSDADITLAKRYLDAAMLRTQSDAAWESFSKVREEVTQREGWLDILLAVGNRDEPDYAWEKLNFHYDPVPTLSKVSCPVLALFGERDDNVVPADNVPMMKAAFEKGGNHDATIVIVKGANHGLVPVPEKGPPLPLHRFTGACPEVYSTMGDWLRKRGFAGAAAKK